MSQDALTFLDLQVHVAQQLGVAEYGAGGDEIAQVPSDTYTLTEIKGYINGGIRMLINVPVNWRWQKPTASFIMWPTTTTGVITVSGVGGTTLTSASADFYPSMVGKSVVSDTNGNSYSIASYTSPTVVVITSDASVDTGDTFTITADGNYTLPGTFGGRHNGDIHYAADSATTRRLSWISEGHIRKMRSGNTESTGYPSQVAIRKMANQVLWEMVVYPTPAEVVTVEFPYELHFTALSADTDVHPAGPHYDEVVLAACEAYAELKGEDSMAGRTQYYQQFALPGAIHQNKQSGPKKLGSLLHTQLDPGPMDHSTITMTLPS